MDWPQDHVRPSGRAYRAWIAGLLLVALVAWAGGDAPITEPAQKSIHSGPVEYRLIVRSKPAQRIHVVSVDLTDPRVSVRLCRGGDDPDADGPWETTLATVPEIAKRENLAAAVNGSMFECKDNKTMAGIHDPYFAGNWARALGWTMSDGKVWSDHPASIEAPSLVVIGDRTVRIGKFDKLPDGATQVVSGVWLLVSEGKNVAISRAGADPRSAVGISADGKQLVFLVVDGDRPDESVGFTLAETADELIQLGCRDAIALDSGGSSTMVWRRSPTDWEVMNHPSDGHTLLAALSVTRPVANTLGVVIRDEASTRPVDPR